MNKSTWMFVVLVAICMVGLVAAEPMDRAACEQAIKNIQMPVDWLGGGNGTREVLYGKVNTSTGQWENYQVVLEKSGTTWKIPEACGNLSSSQKWGSGAGRR